MHAVTVISFVLLVSWLLTCWVRMQDSRLVFLKV